MRLFIASTLFAFALACVLHPVFAGAQDQNPPSPDLNYAISVTADRLEDELKDKSDSITIVTAEEIERHQWRYVLDALRGVPGLSVVESGSPGKTTSVFVRGASSDQVLVFVDGVQVNDPFFGGVQLELLTTDNVERIEVVKGPQSALYGSDAIAGVINIITKNGKSGIHPQAGFEGGSMQTFRESAGVSGSSNNANYSMAFSRYDSEGQFENDELHENTFSGKGSYRPVASTMLSVTGRLQDSQIGIPFNGLTPSPLRNQESGLSLLNTRLHHQSGSYLDAVAQVSFTHINSLFEDPDSVFSPLSRHTSNVYQVGFQNNIHVTHADTLTAGYEFERQRINASDAAGPVPDLNGFDTDIHAFYAQNKFENPTWIITAGFRHDHHNTFGDSTNPRISVAYRPNADWKIRAGAGTGFRAPTAGDLAYPFYGNPDLQPEKSKSWEIGVDKTVGEFLSLSATWFSNRYRDLISFDPNTFIAGNVAKAKSEGLELSGSVAQGPWQVVGSYTYLNTEDEVEKHQLFRRPKHSASLRLAYDTTKWGGSLRFLGVGDRLETDFSAFPSRNVLNPGYTRADIAGYYRLHSNLKVIGRIDNLFDNAYSEVLSFPAPGVSFYTGVDFGI